MHHFVLNHKCCESDELPTFLSWAMDRALGEPPDGHARFTISVTDPTFDIQINQVHAGPHDKYDMRNNTWHTEDECRRRKIHLRAYYHGETSATF